MDCINPCDLRNMTAIAANGGRAVTVKGQVFVASLQAWMGCSYPFASQADADRCAATLKTRSDYRAISVEA